MSFKVRVVAGDTAVMVGPFLAADAALLPYAEFLLVAF